MGKISILISVLIILFKLSGFLYGAIPASERAALIALYNSTNGDSWTNNSGWKTPPLDTDGFAMPGTENTWYGIVSGINVTQISLSNNNLSGSIPSTLGNLGSLELLNMCDNQLSGSIPSELGNLNSLWGIFLNTNQLSGSIPSELANISILQDLYLHYNQLSGSIPPELGNVSTLEGLNLSNNQLSGSIPSELGNLSRLDWLSLSGNQLSGSIPSELGNLGRLECLSLAENRLSGSIPPELGNLANLETLWLDRNLLSGSIPPELGNLLNLKQFLLIYNQLGGSIPSSITNLTNLTYAEIGYNALYTNNDTVRTFLDEKFPGWDSTQTIAPANVSASSMSTSSIRVSWTPILYTGDNGGYKVYYSTTSGGPYTYSGITADKLNTYYDVTGLSPGTTYYLVVKTQTDPHHYSYNGVVSEYSEEVSATTTGALGEKDPPFGSFDTPIDGSTVASSIAVTGWALDDTGIDNVKIYRQQGNSLVYIGDATLVEGARPDVAAAYPQYPNNTKAGWGYMMLTNFLPNGGNGTFVLYAIATDAVGKTTTLGSKTIICDNANAVKPFGAIDTPTQGGIATGSSFINWGWVLTPQPNSIPTDGSTINVWVDSVNIGHPTYNIYRPDIATLFPDYNNSNGAVGYFYLDTTVYADGVHTIHWTATDSGGNTDGIGSRYFSIQNTGAENKQKARLQTINYNINRIAELPIDDSASIRIKRGFRENIEPIRISPDDKGISRIELKELERLEIKLANEEADITGYIVVGSKLLPLPIGSTIDATSAKFCWIPSPGFLGEYRFVFVEKDKNGNLKRKYVTINIVPKY